MQDEPLDDVMRRSVGYDRAQVVREYSDIARQLVSFAPVLDLGCGSGTLLETLKRLGVEASGVDSSPSAVTACLERGCSARQGDLLQYLGGIPEGAYGAIFAGHVVEHLASDSARQFFRDAHRALQSGGRLVLLTPNPRNLYVASEGFWVDPTHLRPYPAPLLRALALDAGFNHVEVRGWWRSVPATRKLSGILRWLATAGLHHPAPALLCIAQR